MAILKTPLCLILVIWLCPTLVSLFSYHFKIATGNQTFPDIDAKFDLSLESFSLAHQKDEPLTYSNTIDFSPNKTYYYKIVTDNLLKPSTSVTFSWSISSWMTTIRKFFSTPTVGLDHLTLSVNVYSYVNLTLKYCAETDFIPPKKQIILSTDNCRSRRH